MRDYPGYTIDSVLQLTQKQISFLCFERAKKDLRNSIWEASLHGCKKGEIERMKSSLSDLEHRMKKVDYDKMSTGLDSITESMFKDLRKEAVKNG